jgi:hypothetical protein
MSTALDESTITRTETATVSDITAGNTYFTVSANLSDDYTTANNAAVRCLAPWDNRTIPSWSDIDNIILEAEDEIDIRCHTTFKAGGKVEVEHFEFRGDQWYARYPFVFNRPYGWTGTQWKLKLMHRNIKDLAIAPTNLPYTGYTGDALAVWTGNDWEEWFNNTNDPFGTSNVSVKTQGRTDDYWLDYIEGWLYFVDTRPARGEYQIQIRYRHGETRYDHATTGSAQRDISKACRLLVQIELLSNEQYRVTQPGGDAAGRIEPADAVDKWEAKVRQLLIPHIEFKGYSDWK